MGFSEGTSASGDETYRISAQTPISTLDRDFTAATAAAPSETFWAGRSEWTTDGVFSILSLEEETSTDQLDYLIPTFIGRNGYFAFGVFGNRAGPLPTVFPERYFTPDGRASFRGKTNGLFVDIDKRIFRTQSALYLDVTFANGIINGLSGNTEVNAFTPAPNPASVRGLERSDLDFNFSADLNLTDMTFVGTAASRSSTADWGDMSGTISGMFYGAPGQAPDETGFVFNLVNADGSARHYGVAAGNHVLGLRPYLTPSTVVTEGQGPSVMVSIADVRLPNGQDASVTASTLLNVSPGFTASFDPGPTQTYTDDTFSLSYNVNGVTFDHDWSFAPIVHPGTDGFGTAIWTHDAGEQLNEYTHHNVGFDLGPSLEGALNNVFLISMSGDNYMDDRDFGFVVFGTRTAPADMPTTGSANFAGETRGVYVDEAGTFYKTGSDLSMTADFGTGAVSGAATNFRNHGYFRIDLTSPNMLDFTFDGTITAGVSLFSGTASSVEGGLGLTGNIEGAFYGDPGAAPDEVGIAYQLGAPGSGHFMAGAGVMGRN